MRHQHRHHDDRVLAALGFVYCSGIGQHQLVKLRHIIDNQTVVKLDAQLPILRVNLLHDADVAVEDLFFVVVADLHDLVAPAVFHSPAAQTKAVGVHGLLEDLVQICRANDTALHGRQNLDILRSSAIVLRQAPLYQVNDGLRRRFGVLLLNKEKVCVPPI